MGTYSFKSAGKTAEQRQAEALTASAVPIGIMTPLRAGTKDGIFAMHASLADQMNDNLRNLLLTNHGERIGLYDFGANLRPLASEFTTQDSFDSQAITRISEAVAKWMPYVSLNDFLSEVDRTENKNTGVIRITVTYTVPNISNDKKYLQVTLYVM